MVLSVGPVRTTGAPYVSHLKTSVTWARHVARVPPLYGQVKNVSVDLNDVPGGSPEPATTGVLDCHAPRFPCCFTWTRGRASNSEDSL